MNATKYDFVIVVLVYRNTKDLKDFFSSLSLPNSKVIVVNSYFDSTSDKEFSKISLEHNADFITVPNNGYGAGNNAGIDFALKHYKFKYLIISNADISLERFDQNVLNEYPKSIIAPKILTLKNKNQNPSTPYKPTKFKESIIYNLYKGKHRHLIYFYYAWNRMNKIMFYLFKKIKKSIFSAHGAFLILPYEVVKQLHPLFNEEMFLFFEENHLGKLAENRGIKIVYLEDIIIRHKEDGSISLLSTNLFPMLRESFMKYYEYWYPSKKSH